MNTSEERSPKAAVNNSLPLFLFLSGRGFAYAPDIIRASIRNHVESGGAASWIQVGS